MRYIPGQAGLLAAIALVPLAVSACDLPTSPAAVLNKCAEEAAPLEEAEVAAALRKHGFPVKPDPMLGCQVGTDTHVVLSTWSWKNRPREDEAVLACSVLGHSVAGEDVDVHFDDGDLLQNARTWGTLLNVECQLDIDRDANPGHIARLRAALTDLAHDYRAGADGA
jgi:hypothetical protein